MRELRLSDFADRRILVVVAHPDDEVLGCGALLAGLGHATVVHVTGGAPACEQAARQHGFEHPSDYAAARRREAAAALALVGVGGDRIVSLYAIDQEVWRSMADVARTLRPLLRDSDVVLSHAYEGGHPDHDAVALAVHAACRLGPESPTIVEMPFYHAGREGWVRQTFLPYPGAGSEDVLWLSDTQRALKRRMLDAHVTQAAVLDEFSLEAERFRRAPHYDFRKLPHAGDLLYERHRWNLTRQLWVEHASAALSELGC